MMIDLTLKTIKQSHKILLNDNGTGSPYRYIYASVIAGCFT